MREGEKEIMKLSSGKITYKLGLTLVWGFSLFLGACTPSDKAAQSLHTNILDLTKETPFYIINGEPVNPQKDSFFYSIVALLNLESGGICTGSIISSRHIVTAAHCMPEGDPRNIMIVFGSDIERAMQSKHFIRAADGLAHPNFAKTMAIAEKQNIIPDYNWGDIAIVKIDQDLPPHYRPADILNVDSAPYRQDSVLSGYGVSDGVRDNGSGILRKTSVFIENPVYSETESSVDQTKGTGACRGDSGGPAYLKFEHGYGLWGITSRGHNDPNFDCSQYAIYTKVAAYRDWIIEARLILAQRTLPALSSTVIALPTDEEIRLINNSPTAPFSLSK